MNAPLNESIDKIDNEQAPDRLAKGINLIFRVFVKTILKSNSYSSIFGGTPSKINISELLTI